MTTAGRSASNAQDLTPFEPIQVFSDPSSGDEYMETADDVSQSDDANNKTTRLVSQRELQGLKSLFVPESRPRGSNQDDTQHSLVESGPCRKAGRKQTSAKVRKKKPKLKQQLRKLKESYKVLKSQYDDKSKSTAELLLQVAVLEELVTRLSQNNFQANEDKKRLTESKERLAEWVHRVENKNALLKQRLYDLNTATSNDNWDRIMNDRETVL